MSLKLGIETTDFTDDTEGKARLYFTTWRSGTKVLSFLESSTGFISHGPVVVRVRKNCWEALVKEMSSWFVAAKVSGNQWSKS